MPTKTITSADTTVDLTALIDVLVTQQQARIAAKPWKEAKLIVQFERRLDSLFNQVDSFITKVLSGKAAKFQLANYVFEADKGLEIAALTKTYGGFTLTEPPDAQAILDGNWNISGALSYSATEFREARTNDGAISSDIRITLTGDKFSGESGDSLGVVTNVPQGLTASLVKLTDTTAVLRFSGKATVHSANNKIENLRVEFLSADFQSNSVSQKSGVLQTLDVVFYSLMLSESNNHLAINHLVAEDLIIDLSRDRVMLGGVVNDFESGYAAAVTDVNLENLSATGVEIAISVIGDWQNNTVTAPQAPATYQMGSGSDTLHLGTAIDTIVFESTAAKNGIDEIHNFTIGANGDILDFSDFLNITRTDLIEDPVNVDTGTGATTWSNGDVVIMVGSGLSTAANVHAAFTTQFSAHARGKAVVITADVVGDAYVWYLVNQNDVTVISEPEFSNVATIIGLNNFLADGYQFDPTNFL